jgi:hypothetical protein
MEPNNLYLIISYSILIYVMHMLKRDITSPPVQCVHGGVSSAKPEDTI